MNRSFTRRIALGALLLGATLAACSKKEAPPAPAAAPAPAKPEPLKAAFIYVGPVGDAGWSYSHDLGRRTAVEKFGADKVTTTFVEKVPEGPDAERVLRDLVAQGNKLVFATSFGFMESIVKVAKDNPEVRFEHATGYKTSDNLRVYEAKFYEGAYLAGVVAGKMTKTNTLGFVGSFPIPEVLRNINAYTLGAQSVNPKVKTRVVWVNSWFDPPKETEAAQSLLNQGADVLLQNTDSTAVLQAAERNGKLGFGWDSDMSAFAPKAHLGSVALNWAGYYEKSFREASDKSWKPEVTKWGVKEGMIDFVKPASFLPADVQQALETAREGLKTGAVAVFKGPLVDNAGKEVLAKDVVADDAWKGAINFYVKGVEGKVPSGN
ncbi:basic membrane lipoprotein [Anaeromyxobacter sp. K]|uniref:BMP family ABC transporter substrate-binding protein n=1 Tax=Anaeromyxobacter sp. (strain K) TaxID=447217 RepID=UPI00015F8C32|nr:BMP family ABC transporter substrate-binding protein [Anaeromyxobacter sp. K]ACG72295.1 basic membrane lipoprotein [Anaeromyxobacter sp. K]